MCDTLYGIFFFFNDTATTEIYTLSLHDALPICRRARGGLAPDGVAGGERPPERGPAHPRTGRTGHRGAGLPAQHRRSDRKSTRLNSSHANISYAVFCLKKKKICRSSASAPM